MRVSATTTSLSWIPSESVWGPLKLGFDLGLSHWDEPMPDRISGVDEVQALHDAGGSGSPTSCRAGSTSRTGGSSVTGSATGRAC